MGASGQRRFAFPRSHRLTRGADLDAVRREGKRVRTEHLEVRAVASLQSLGELDTAKADTARLPAAGVRVGIIVPRHKHSAVDRNRLKRRLRELARTRLLPQLTAQALTVDLVVRVRPEAYDASFESLGRQVERVARELVKKLGRAAPEPPAEGRGR